MQNSPKVEVIEAEFDEIDPKTIDSPRDIGNRAGAALEALAELVGRISPPDADKLRTHATTARSIGQDVERAKTAGTQLLESVKSAMDKAGIKIEMVKREPARVTRARAAREAAEHAQHAQQHVEANRQRN